MFRRWNSEKLFEAHERLAVIQEVLRNCLVDLARDMHSLNVTLPAKYDMRIRASLLRLVSETDADLMTAIDCIIVDAAFCCSTCGRLDSHFASASVHWCLDCKEFIKILALTIEVRSGRECQDHESLARSLTVRGRREYCPHP